MSGHLDLADLVSAAQSGDGAALESLIARVRPNVFRYVLAHLVDQGSAEDVTQEVIMTIVSALPRYVDTGKSVLAWIFGIASRKVSEAHRSQRRRPETVVEAMPDRAVAGRANDPESAAMGLETTRQMADLLASLPPPQGEIVRLRIAAGLSAEETARVLGLTAGAVRVAQHRALTKLRAQIDREAVR